MGIRQALRRHPGSEDLGVRRLRLTEPAVEAIRARIAETGSRSVFFVRTQPSRLGFNVAVGFEDGGDGVPARGDTEVPIRITDEDWDLLSGYTLDFRDGRFATSTDVSVHVSVTPNPESRKFMLNRTLLAEGGASYPHPAREDDPILVRYLLEIPGIRSLFFIGNFCTATRDPAVPWEDLEPEVGKRLQAYIAHGGRALEAKPREAGQLSDVERRIVELLDDAVRPAVQRDGGDILFAGFDDGRVQLYMQGSCVGCPSSLATLKMGVENLLRDAIPEVREVVAID